MSFEEMIRDVEREEGKCEGEIIGVAKAKDVFVRNLLQGIDLPVEKIAALAEVPVDFVERLKEQLVA